MVLVDASDVEGIHVPPIIEDAHGVRLRPRASGQLRVAGGYRRR